MAAAAAAQRVDGGAAAGGGGGLWLVGRGAHVVFICFVKKTGFCTIEARILGQDRLTYCAAFSNLGVGVSTIVPVVFEVLF